MKLGRVFGLSLGLVYHANAFVTPQSSVQMSSTSATTTILCASNEDSSSPIAMSRREYMQNLSKLLTATTVATIATETINVPNSFAFENKISDKYDDRPKRKGPQPKDIGVGKRKDMVGEEYTGLKNCGPAPNCFCSTDDVEDDPDHSIPAWTWPENLTKKEAFGELEDALKNYKPGQDNIDGGGFKIIKVDSDKGYIYAQFEALKNGYIDDVEFAYIDGLGDNAVQVRSSSRVGYLDFGVNSKRLNYIAKTLKEKGSKGWTAPGVEYKTHKGYFMENQVSP